MAPRLTGKGYPTAADGERRWSAPDRPTIVPACTCLPRFLGGPMAEGQMGEGHEVVMVVAPT